MAAAAVVLLRTATDDPARPVTARPTSTAPVAPTSPAQTSPAPAPPYDRRPGRTPIPVPVQTYNQLSGPLPATGSPSKVAASRAVRLVLGRFCEDPARYTFTLSAEGGSWRQVRALVFGLQSSGDGPVQDLSLYWTGRSYRWIGPLSLLRGC